MSESLHEMAIRMSGDECNHRCADCPANKLRDKGPCVVYVFAQAKNADEQIEALKRWASEHPKKTWLDLLREKLPDSRYAKDHVAYPSECPSVFLGGDAPHYSTCSTSDCRECWNSEVTNK